MIQSEEQILAEIDATLDQLICNAEALKFAPIASVSEMEIEALQKTQESLLAHVFHMNTLLDAEKKQRLLQKQNGIQLEEKIAHFSRLNTQLIQHVAHRFKTKSKRSLRKSIK